MRKVVVKIKGLSPVGFNKFYDVPKENKESHDDYEKRTWRERAHYDENGEVYLHPLMFKKCLANAAKYISMQIKGKGKATYTKHFLAGIAVFDKAYLGVKKDDIKGTWIHVPADGRPGGSKRVMKCFPTVENWECEIMFHILDDIITSEVFEKHLREAGNFIGIGGHRVQNGGYFGRFKPIEFKWED